MAEVVLRLGVAEAKAYEAIKEAEAQKAHAEALRFAAEQEAEGVKARGVAEADARAYDMARQAEAAKVQAEATRFSMEQEAEGIRAKGLAEAEAIEKKADAQKKMGEASVLEMYLTALPEVVKNAAAPLAQTDRIVMYGDGNSTKLVKDVMSTASQIIDGVKESTGLDITAMLSGAVGGKLAAGGTAEREAMAASGQEETPGTQV